MKKSKFTGGVWAQERPFSPKIVACYEDSYEHIATVEIPRREDMKAAKLEAAANARLITAAPRLYAALEQIAKECVDEGSDDLLFARLNDIAETAMSLLEYND